MFIALPKILKNSECEFKSEILTCTCISRGSPLPVIKWPLLENHTEYSVTTTVSKITVSSTITLTVKDHMRTVLCIGTNDAGNVKQIISIKTSKRPAGEHTHVKISTDNRENVI